MHSLLQDLRFAFRLIRRDRWWYRTWGGMLGVFVLAFFVKRCTANAAFVGVLAGEVAILITAQFTGAYLWFNVIGCAVVVAVGWALSAGARGNNLPPLGVSS